MLKQNKKEKGVSPVVGVILMVAITVIIAAVVANFVLDLGQQLGSDADASVTFDEEIDNFSQDTYNVTVSVSSMDNADYLAITTVGNEADGYFPTYTAETPSEVDNAPNNPSGSDLIGGNNGAILVNGGDVVTVTGLDQGDTVQVFGGLDGQENEITTYEVGS